MHGLGNDFMVINALHQKIDFAPNKIRKWANRHFGIGFDQLMVLLPAQKNDADFSYRIFNADGMEVEQCGNGVRCLAHFIYEKNLSSAQTLHLATEKTVVICERQANKQIKINMGHPDFSPASLPFLINTVAPYYEKIYRQRVLSFGAVSLGNPHVVFSVPDVSQAEVDYLGNFFNQDTDFPQGVNVGFMEIISPEEIKLRVYERGAGETLACGTGACAAVSVGQLWQKLSKKVLVHLPGGDLSIEHQLGQPLFMTGSAELVYDGVYFNTEDK